MKPWARWPGWSRPARLRHLLALDVVPASHAERLLSTLGGVLGMTAVFLASRALLPESALLPVVASMGASAVLLFAVSHGQLSQPWPLLAGHVLSALVGVTCALFIAPPWLAAPLAVGLSIGLMHYLGCLHPPGGATALVAVIGGPGVTGLGYHFALAPVALNALTLLLVALAFNAPFPWRRYPAGLAGHGRGRPSPAAADDIRHEDFVYALSQIDTFVDISEEELLRIYALARGHGR